MIDIDWKRKTAPPNGFGEATVEVRGKRKWWAPWRRYKHKFRFVFGADGEPRTVKWSDKDDFDSFEVTHHGEAGSHYFDQDREVKRWAVNGSSVLVVTDQRAYLLEYIGPPYTFSKKKIADIYCGAVDVGEIPIVDGIAVWRDYSAGFSSYRF
jgi:hypothetical protein